MSDTHIDGSTLRGVMAKYDHWEDLANLINERERAAQLALIGRLRLHNWRRDYATDMGSEIYQEAVDDFHARLDEEAKKLE